MKNYTYAINDASGQRIEGFHEVAQMMVHYYLGLLGQRTNSRVFIQKEVISMGITLLWGQQLQLCALFTKEDVKQAMFSIPNIKSPRPGHYSSGFFKHCW